MPETLQCNGEYTVDFRIKQPSRAGQQAIDGHALSAATEAGRNKVAGWSDNPDGIKYEFDHVELNSVEQIDIDDDVSWDGSRSWKYDGKAHYTLCYKKLQ
ncbi:hypothetical protein [Bacillus inaquosorum]|uniref:hypothetical protein n=1 Tax=Bacillus inaquosorum TaxID=483913 RepID=UPI002DBC1821|nr:hypothetical protein [Bacillus inaquosorum]MEC2062590.1 hypothetical protein [Bacillus inaquosorum]MEC2086267.1 hypothetical protein [Bacillus inaquosorum]